ncbi:MAG: UDP-N-acetylmuramoyl-L-alanyl-D-glutamate--2,6-diaminopimelate ligase [Terriglobia bacterium]
MILDDLLKDADILDRRGESSREIHGLAYDSRQASSGYLFFAVEGERVDGHRFIDAVMRAGAAGVVSERPAPDGFPGVWIKVRKIRRALAELSSVFYGHPDSRLKLVGITGTNGKTTTAFLLDSIFRAAGMKTGLFGTIEYRLDGSTVAAIHTTPEALDLIGYLAELVGAGCEAAVMEASSHALAQERVWGFHFAAAIFTNLTEDHLDYHKDMETYFAAKRRLFEGEGAPPPELGVINLDDPWGERLQRVAQPRQITYGVDSNAQVKARHFSQGSDGIRAVVTGLDGKFEIASPLMGRANLENVLAAVAAAQGLGIPVENIQQGIAALQQVPGRFERVNEGQPFIVLVDYAHTHDALRNALKIARELTRERLILVFGCGGDRDRAKRPLMGEVAGALSDVVVLTSDNPRSEDPILIMNDAMVGLQKSGKAYRAQVDREKGIREALEQAREGDVVLIAGKGHETYQVLNNRTIPFDDREVARRVLREMGFKKGEGAGGA